jgi:quaternary ammonium compound-resistance protein SugE
MAWVLLALAGVFETAWALLLKESDGLSKLGPSVGFVATAAASLVLLMLALRDLPVGTAYAVWTGIGVAGTAVFGMVLQNEPADVARLASLALILGGVVSLYANDH